MEIDIKLKDAITIHWEGGHEYLYQISWYFSQDQSGGQIQSICCFSAFYITSNLALGKTYLWLNILNFLSSIASFFFSVSNAFFS